MQRAALSTCLLSLLGPLTSPPARAQETPLTDPLDARVAECDRRMDGDCLLALADFAAAADVFTRFALEHRDDQRAPAALARTVELWRELGQPERFHQSIGGQLNGNVGPTNDNEADAKVDCRSRLGGGLNYYHREAA